MDLQWILDKLLETGTIDAAQTARIDVHDDDIKGLKGLYDRVKTLETRGEVETEQERSNPTHRQVLISGIAAVASIAAAIASFIALTSHSHP